MSQICSFAYFVAIYSAREKLDEDIAALELQVKLQAGEIEPPSDPERPSDAVPSTPMVSDHAANEKNGF